MTKSKSKKEYLTLINGGAGWGTTWRSNTIRDAVETCAIVATQDWGVLRGIEVPVGVYDVTGISPVTFTPGGYVITETTGGERTEIPPLFFVMVDVPKLRKNGHAYGKTYRRKVQEAAYTALQKALWKWREERVETAVEDDPMMQELLSEYSEARQDK